MENEKKKSGTPLILMIFVIILLIAVTTYLWLDTQKTVSNKEEEISKLNESVNSLKVEIENFKNIKADEEEDEEKENEKVEEIEDVLKLLKDGGEYDTLRISSIKEDDDKYLVSATYYKPITITEKEYEDMVEEEKISIQDKEYLFEEEENEQLVSYGYGYIYEENQEVYSGYCVYKTDNGYIFLRDVGGVSLTIDEEEKEISFYLENDTEVNEITVDTCTLEEYLSKDKSNYKVDKYKMTVVYDENDEISLEADKR